MAVINRHMVLHLPEHAVVGQISRIIQDGGSRSRENIPRGSLGGITQQTAGHIKSVVKETQPLVNVELCVGVGRTVVLSEIGWISWISGNEWFAQINGRQQTRILHTVVGSLPAVTEPCDRLGIDCSKFVLEESVGLKVGGLQSGPLNLAAMADGVRIEIRRVGCDVRI